MIASVSDTVRVITCPSTSPWVTYLVLAMSFGGTENVYRVREVKLKRTKFSLKKLRAAKFKVKRKLKINAIRKKPLPSSSANTFSSLHDGDNAVKSVYSLIPAVPLVGVIV
jgi:hypothetical protein